MPAASTKQRTKSMHLSWSDEEHHRLRLVAGDAGKHLTAFVREAAQREINRRYSELMQRLQKVPVSSEAV
jgi:hypothetical protein